MSYQSIWIGKKDEILACVEKVRRENPAAWDEVRVPGQPSRTFIGLVAAECQKTVSPEIGCNLKRGGPDVSLDVLAMPNVTGVRDSTGKYPGLELIDIIGGAEGGPDLPPPSIIWLDQTVKTIDAGAQGGWIKSAGPTPVPVPPPVVGFSYPDENTTVKAYQARVKATYAEAKREFPDPNDSDAFRWFSRYGFSCREMPEPQAADKHIAELRADLKL